MSAVPNQKQTLRTAGAIMAGFLVIVVLSIGTDFLTHAIGVFPEPGEAMSAALYILATVYRVIYSILGCYITARLAPNRPMRHALWLGLVGVLFSIAGTVATWNLGPEFGPHWYPIALILLSMPCAWLGAKLYSRETT